MKILALHRQNSAVGYYRTWLRCRVLKELGHDVTYWEGGTYHTNLMPKASKVRPERRAEQYLREQIGNFDILYVDRALSRDEWGVFAAFRHYSPNCRMIVDTDDLFTDVPPWSPVGNHWKPGQESFDSGLEHFKVSEIVTLSTPQLVEALGSYCHRPRLLENYIDPGDWEGLPVNPERERDPHLRILYAGASGHLGDIEEARAGLEAVLRNPPVPIRLICFGALPRWMYDLSKEFPGRVVTLPWVAFPEFPAAVAWGGFDLAIVPLAHHPFNYCKSKIKILEHGLQKIPMVVSRVGPYADIPDGTALRVENTPVQWADALRTALRDKDLRESLKDECYQYVRDTWTLDKAVEKIQIIFEEAASCPRIMTLEDTYLPSERPGPTEGAYPDGATQQPLSEGRADEPDPNSTS